MVKLRGIDHAWLVRAGDTAEPIELVRRVERAEVVQLELILGLGGATDDEVAADVERVTGEVRPANLANGRPAWILC